MFPGLAASLLTAAVAVSAGPAPSQYRAQSACSQLKSSLADVTHLPSSPQYSALCNENWSGTARGNPACIVRPTTAAQVQQIDRSLVAHKVRFAIRSGGHSPSPRSANIDQDGVLIDLSGLNQVTYDAASGTARVGAGNTWRKVYNVLDAYNVTAVGGRVVDVGVGGFLLGSGLSYLTDLYGLGCDNVVEHELTRKCHGKGIVTSFNISTYPIHHVWGGTKGYSLDQLPALYDAMATYQATAPKDLYANVMLQAFTTNVSVGAVLTMVYLEPEANPAAFDPFYSIPTTFDVTRLQTLTELMSAQYVPDIPRIDWFATSFKPDRALYQTINSLTTSTTNLAPVSALTAGSLAIGLQPIAATAVTAGRARGRGNALGLAAEDQTWFVLDVGWWHPADDRRAHNATASIRQSISGAAAQGGHGVPYLFSNDASYDQPVIEAYGAENVAKLREVQKKYDPTRVFQTLVPGGHVGAGHCIWITYGGRHVGRWVSGLPASWVPFVQLARLSPPAALALIYFPHLFGAVLAAITHGGYDSDAPAPPAVLLRACSVLLIGSFFFSNAAHAWNDLIDAPLDAQVARTRSRPIPRGAITSRAALAFAVTQAAGAAAVLLLAFPDPVRAALYVLPNVLATAYYPWAKRHTNFAQLVLGFCLAWGIVVGYAAMGREPFALPRYLAGPPGGGHSSQHAPPLIHPPAACLLLACVLWTAIYDTIYAHQDRKDDAALGLRSMAVLFGERATKPVLWLALACMAGLLAACGTAAGMAWPYLAVSLTGCVLSLGAMIANVELADAASCWWWFRYGFWLAGSSIAGGLAVEYMLRLTRHGMLWWS
ncbi:hypothetical protein C8A00DRAFT_47468 [Chaetomidium leptoderma]|uniref:FAD-binding PCMH-type domain-containing protein n=1 Tax=Chaetomidium leptoderma TaxID=669021 RepID=A0AAN6VDA7_9PEZI|nr:hypothetical protein C8A00DRAFT_47468 [Chaetomidium leptoderma]